MAFSSSPFDGRHDSPWAAGQPPGVHQLTSSTSQQYINQPTSFDQPFITLNIPQMWQEQPTQFTQWNPLQPVASTYQYVPDTISFNQDFRTNFHEQQQQQQPQQPIYHRDLEHSLFDQRPLINTNVRKVRPDSGQSRQRGKKGRRGRRSSSQQWRHDKSQNVDPRQQQHRQNCQQHYRQRHPNGKKPSNVLRGGQAAAFDRLRQKGSTSRTTPIAVESDSHKMSEVIVRPSYTNLSNSQPSEAARRQVNLSPRSQSEPIGEASVDSRDVSVSPKNVHHHEQLECVPAVLGFVCKACNVFLFDSMARHEHIESDEHLQKFKEYTDQQGRSGELANNNVQPRFILANDDDVSLDDSLDDRLEIASVGESEQ